MGVRTSTLSGVARLTQIVCQKCNFDTIFLTKGCSYTGQCLSTNPLGKEACAFFIAYVSISENVTKQLRRYHLEADAGRTCLKYVQARQHQQCERILGLL